MRAFLNFLKAESLQALTAPILACITESKDYEN